jgi:hypothetical protein
MAVRDIRVKLTPEGVTEVVAALRKVQTEAAAASRQSESSVRGLRTALVSLRSVLSGLGVGVSIAGFVAIGRAAFQAANEVIDASKRIGVSAEEYSRLSEAAKTANVDLGALESSIRTLQRNLSKALSDPGGEAAVAFKQLRIEAEAFSKLSLEDQLALIADRVTRLADAEDKTRAVTDLLGKSAAELIPLLNQGGEGFIKLADDAAAAGKVLTNDTARAIDQADAAIKRLKGSVNALATDFLASLSSLFLGFPDEIAKVAQQIRTLQRDIAFFTTGPAQFLPGAEGKVKALKEDLAEARKQYEALISQATPAATPGPASTPDDPFSQLAEIETAAQKRARLELERDRIQSELKLQAQRLKLREEADKRAYDAGVLSLEEYFRRRSAVIKAAADAEIAALKRQVQLVQAAPAVDEDERLRQTAEVAKLRADIAAREIETQRELAGLEGERFALSRDLGEQQVEVQNRLDELEGKRHEVFQRNLQEEIRGVIELGRRIGLTEAQITGQVQRLTSGLTLKFNFETATRETEQTLDAFRRDADQIRRDQEAGVITQLEGENRLLDLTRRRLEVLRAMSAAALSAAQATGDEQAIAQAQRLSDSVAEIEASFFAATNTFGRFRQALESGLQTGIADFLTDIVLNLESLEDALIGLLQTVVRSLAEMAAQDLAKQATAGLLSLVGGGGAEAAASTAQTAGAAATTTAAGALATAGGAVTAGASAVGVSAGALATAGGGLVTGAAAVSAAAAQLLAAASTLAASQGATAGVGLIGAFASGGALDARGGGMLRGPGTPTSDSILLFGSTKEYMVRARAAQQPGARSFLDAFNSGRIRIDEIRRALKTLKLAPGFARGGSLSQRMPTLTLPAFAMGGSLDLASVEQHGFKPSGGPSSMAASLLVGLDPGLVLQTIQSDQGVDVLAKTMSRQPGRFRSLLGLRG